MLVACLDLSTAHLRRPTMDMLGQLDAAARMAAGWPAMTVAPYDYGVFLTVPDQITADQAARMPCDLMRVLYNAQRRKVTLLRFDKDGDTDEELISYAW